MGVDVQLYAPAALPPGKRPSTYCIGGRVGPRAGLDEWGKSCPPPPGFTPQTIQHVAIHYTDCTTPLKVSLPISRHLCQDKISLLPNLLSNSDEMANQLFMLLPELPILKKQNKWGVWIQWIHVTMTVTVNTVGNLVLLCQYFMSCPPVPMTHLTVRWQNQTVHYHQSPRTRQLSPWIRNVNWI